MPTVEPTSILMVALSKLRDMLAGSTAFQEWCGVTSATEAKQRIFYYAMPFDSQTKWPFCVIEYGSGWQASRTAGGDVNVFEDRGMLRLTFEDKNVVPSYSEADALITFGNHVGGVLLDVLSLSGGSGQLNVVSIRDADIAGGGPCNPCAEDGKVIGDVWIWKFNVEWSEI